MELQDRHTLTAAAMGTVFRLTVAHPDRRYARQAAAAALAELELVEGRLSRFLETSDVFRVNRLCRGQSTVVHPDTRDCLRIALEVQASTGGAFDPTYASAGKHRARRIELLDPGCVVRVLADGVRLDLGGIGKGFALDRMAAVLAEWEIGSALLSASTSTVLALDPPGDGRGWAVHIGTGTGGLCLDLVRRAISGSGIAVRGAHVIDPRTGRPAQSRFRAWALAPTAAEADALSTAFLVMGQPEIRDYCCRHPAVAAYLMEVDGAALVPIAPPAMGGS